MRSAESGPAKAEQVAVAVFTALADPTRRALLNELARRGPATVSDLARALPITRQGVAKHLEQLVEAGLGEARPAGRPPPPIPPRSGSDPGRAGVVGRAGQ